MRETRMNTAFLCRSISLCVCSSRFTLGNGMEEAVGSIPTRSTNYINNLEAPPLSDFVASLSQIPKPHHEPASHVLRQPHPEC